MENKYAQFLTYKQQTFCDEYLVDMNATRAALRAGYSAGTALNGALMRMPKIKLYLEQHIAKAAQRTQITQDMVLNELAKIAFGNMGNYFGTDGKLKPMDSLTDDEKAALWSVTMDKEGTIRLKMNNKMQALDKIAKHLDFYKPEEKRVEKVYVYLDKADMVEDDYFEEEEEDEEMQEARGKNQDEEGNCDDDLPLVDDEGIVLRDSAGIPYDETADRSKYFLDLNETPAQLMARLGLGDSGAVPAVGKAILPVRDDPDRNYGYPKCFKVTRG
jgi:hypothetical protein